MRFALVLSTCTSMKQEQESFGRITFGRLVSVSFRKGYSSKYFCIYDNSHLHVLQSRTRQHSHGDSVQTL